MRRRYPRSPSVESRESIEDHSRFRRCQASSERYVQLRGETERDDRGHSSRTSDADYYRGYSPESSYRSSRYSHTDGRKRRRQSPPGYSPNGPSPPPRRVRYRSSSPHSPRTRRRSARDSYERESSPDRKIEPRSPQESHSGDHSPSYNEGYEDDSCRVGSILKGRYRIMETLGDSTFSKVVQAFDLEKNQVIALEIMKSSEKSRDGQRRDARLSADGIASRSSTSRPNETPNINYQYGIYPYGTDPRTMFGYPSSPTLPTTTTAAAPQMAPFPSLPAYPSTAFPPAVSNFLRMSPLPPGTPQLPPYFPPWGLRPPPLMSGPRGSPGQVLHRPPAPNHNMSALTKFRNDPPHLFYGRMLQPDVPNSRSQSIEMIRSLNYTSLSLADIQPRLVEFSQDQYGSRFIQTKLKRATREEQDMVFDQIINNAYDLMQNMFGNYVIQKFFESGSLEQRTLLVSKMKGQVMALAFNIYGCRVLQKALESVSLEYQLQIVQELMAHVINCVKDQNGNHVIQKAIETINAEAIEFIIKSFYGRILDIGAHPYGCRVVQKLLQHCTQDQKVPLLKEFHECSAKLMLNQFGNYVVQHVLENGDQEDRSKIVGQIIGNVFQLAQHKFASNVVEKCVVQATRGERTLLIEEICTSDDDINSPLCTLVRDQFGNYVVQKMIELATESQRKTLVDKLSPHVSSLSKTTFGKHFFFKMKKYFDKWHSSNDHSRDQNSSRRYRRSSSGSSDG